MSALLSSEEAIGIVTLHLQVYTLHPYLLTRGLVNDRHLPALFLTEACVHLLEHGDPIASLVSPCSGEESELAAIEVVLSTQEHLRLHLLYLREPLLMNIHCLLQKDLLLIRRSLLLCKHQGSRHLLLSVAESLRALLHGLDHPKARHDLPSSLGIVPEVPCIGVSPSTARLLLPLWRAEALGFQKLRRALLGIGEQALDLRCGD
mmetsp:Transcript_8963/g.19788  ORF Transcript_8963/g.19788 Transcript_8963/m.19788 type:complete len:205 (-) Transcript_8963:437-1051(-)